MTTFTMIYLGGMLCTALFLGLVIKMSIGYGVIKDARMVSVAKTFVLLMVWPMIVPITIFASGCAHGKKSLKKDLIEAARSHAERNAD